MLDFVNAQWVREGFSEHDVMTPANLLHPEDLPGFTEKWLNSIATGEPYEVELRLRKANGEYRWYLARSVALRDDSGTVVKRYATATDIDDRKRAEETLRAGERELQNVVDTIPALVWCLAPDGEPDYVGERMATYYGRKVDYSDRPLNSTRLLRALSVLMHPDDVQAIHGTLMQSLKTGEPFMMRYRNRRFDGVYRWVDARAEPLRDDEGRIVQVVWRQHGHRR